MNNNIFDLSGKVTLITGGNGGIGLGMAEAIAKSGGQVAIWGTNKDKNANAVEQLSAYGSKIAAFECDVTNETAVRNAFSDTLAHFGRVDGCIANAGVSGSGQPFLEISAEEWRRVMAVNLDGTFFTYQAVLRHMVERSKKGDSGGRLVAISSLASQSGAVRNEHYAATKGGLNAMTYALAVEFARFGITANAILPGWIETGMTVDKFTDERFTNAVLPRIPVKRYGTPTDFGGAAVFLMSDASSYYNGQCMMIDGGYWRF